jgi:hypothetical protein
MQVVLFNSCDTLSSNPRSFVLMKPRDLFALAVRLIGLVFLYHSLSSVPMAIAAVCPRFPHFIWTNLFAALFTVGWPLLVAYWLLRGAPPILRIAYPDPEAQPSSPAPELLNR